jgi:putative FmdB family regulatory protein
MPMPLYEYRCDCGAAFETLVRTHGEADEQSCPTCGAAHARRLMSVFSSPRATGSDGAAMPAGGGCCGGACGSC